MRDAPNQSDGKSRDPGPEWTLADLAAVLVRRRMWPLGFCAGFLLLAVVWWAVSAPRYRARAEIEVQSRAQGAFGLENTTSDQSSPEVSNSFDANLNLQTEMGILQSDALALAVIRRAGLEETPDYFGPHNFGPHRVGALDFRRRRVEPLSVPLEQAPERRYAALKIFSKRLRVATVPGTRLIAISYTDSDPGRAARVVNTLLQSLADYGFQSRSEAAAQSAGWLSTQLAELKKQTEALDARAASLDRQSGNLGDDDTHNIVLARLDELNTAYSTAESNRILRESIWRAVESGNPEVISGLGVNPAAGAGTQNAFALLQSLRAQEAGAKAQLAESANRYGENWPAVAEQKARLTTIQHSIQEEVHRLGERARSDYEVAATAERSAKAALDAQRELASRMTGSAVALRLARQEAAESRGLYAGLLGKLQQAGVLQGLHSGNFTVVSPAMAPPADHPANPGLSLLCAMALAGGLCLGSVAAVLRELTDESIRSPGELEALLDAPVFAAIPAERPQEAWYRRLLPSRTGAVGAFEAAAGSDFAAPARESPWVEALHRLRASLLLSHSESPPQVILITGDGAANRDRAGVRRSRQSSYEEQESASVALGLATVLAQHGAPTLYVDADLRAAPCGDEPSAEPGLSDLLAGDARPALDTAAAGPALLSILPSGPRPPCPSELIASRRMTGLLASWRQEFTFIVIDGPAGRYADALVLAQYSDAVLVSVAAGKSTRADVLPAFHSLSRQIPRHAVLGLVLQGAPHAHA